MDGEIKSESLQSTTELTSSWHDRKVRILLVQPHSLLATTIANLLLEERDLTLCGIVQTGADAAAFARGDKPDVLLIDFKLSDMTGPAAATLIRTSAPQAALVFFNADASETALLDAIDVGAAAYLTKSNTTADGILEAVRRAANAEVLIPVSLFAKAIRRRRNVIVDAQARKRLLAEFTPRELEVLHQLAQGFATDEVAEHLGIASHTVEWHVRHLIEKLQVHSKLQAVIEAARKGLIDL